jgi:hypothetical protein
LCILKKKITYYDYDTTFGAFYFEITSGDPVELARWLGL